MSGSRSLFSRPRFAITLMAVLVAVDQLVKWAVETYLPFHQRVDLLPTLALFRTHNEDIAFSMLTGLGDRWLIALTLVVITFVTTLWVRSAAERWLSQLGFALIMAGAVGNLIDRVMLGYVVDYVLFHVGSWSFAVFNIADALITIGAAAIVIDELFGRWLYAGERERAK